MTHFFFSTSVTARFSNTVLSEIHVDGGHVASICLGKTHAKRLLLNSAIWKEYTVHYYTGGEEES